MDTVVGGVSGGVEGVNVIRRARRARKIAPFFSDITTTTTCTFCALCVRGCGGYITARRRLSCRIVLKRGRHLPFWVSCACS